MAATHFNEPILLMTQGNMRTGSVRPFCHLCHHAASPAQLVPDHRPAFGPRAAYPKCGIISADAMPNWREPESRFPQKQRGKLRGGVDPVSAGPVIVSNTVPQTPSREPIRERQ
jgi:hypothetical protein